MSRSGRCKPCLLLLFALVPEVVTDELVQAAIHDRCHITGLTSCSSTSSSRNSVVDRKQCTRIIDVSRTQQKNTTHLSSCP